MRNRALFLALALAGVFTVSRATAQTSSCPDSATPVLLLGTWHMDNPGKDMLNLKADDVRAPRRQKEIEDLVNRLAAFRPTRVLIEAPYGDAGQPRAYAEYLAGKHELSRDEREQVAFRLARKMNLPTVAGIDHPMDLDDSQLNLLMKSSPELVGKTMEGLQTEGQKEMTKQQSLLARSSVTEFYRYQNSEAAVELNHQFYFKYLVPIADGQNYAGADMVASWYKRNLRIMNNLERLQLARTDRVFILFGQGHVKLLRDFINATPGYCVVNTEAYLQ
ncbi:MAG TPA: DUF5694 domain-containing protein [Terriglobales bacterium]|jgi:hypothetical protein|nr:DUF5694 domain-containing protein [Terriglobales bacterium]